MCLWLSFVIIKKVKIPDTQQTKICRGNQIHTVSDDCTKIILMMHVNILKDCFKSRLPREARLVNFGHCWQESVSKIHVYFLAASKLYLK